MTADNQPRFESTWLLEPVALPDRRKGPGFLYFFSGNQPAPLAGLPFENVDPRASPADLRALYALFRMYLFDYRADLTLPLLLLIDGHALVYRGFYALQDTRPFTTSKGELTTGVYAFTSMLLKAIEDLKPQYAAAAFDMSRPTYRLSEFAAYKGTQYTVVHIDASDDDRKEMVAFADHWVGGQYDWATIVSITLSLLTGLKLRFGFPGQLICSGLVARALERTTAIFDEEPSHVMPAELAKMFDVVPPPPDTPKGKPARCT